MPPQIQPSNPGYDFSSADLTRAGVSVMEAARVILAAKQEQGSAFPDPAALLAAIFKDQRKQNAKFQPVAFSLDIWMLQQVLNENPLRSYLIVQNVGSADIMILHETSNTVPQDYSAASAQNELTIKQTRAIRVVSGGYYEPLVAPSNPISIFTLGAGTNGVVIEGV